MRQLGNYRVEPIGADGRTVRYEATHVVFPRRAIIELVETTAPPGVAVGLMRRACILEALHHPSVPRVFDCGMFEGRAWVAFERSDDLTLEAELRHGPLEITDVLDLLERVGAILAHAHARGVLHLNVTAAAIVWRPSLMLIGWEHACPHDAQGPYGWRADVLALGEVALGALELGGVLPAALASLLAKMLGNEEIRPTAADVVATVRAIRDPELGRAVDAALDSLVNACDDGVIEYVVVEAPDEPDEAYEPVLPAPRRRTAPWTPLLPVKQRAEVETTLTTPRINAD